MILPDIDFPEGFVFTAEHRTRLLQAYDRILRYALQSDLTYNTASCFLDEQVRHETSGNRITGIERKAS